MEFVWVVKREDLFPGRAPHGLALLDDGAVADLSARIAATGFFLERRHAERDPAFQQVIPYCVVACGDRVLRTRRLPRGGEARLHGKRSVGIGGHLEPCDAPDVLTSGLRRELEEELSLPGGWRARPVGLLKDDTTEVGSVHVGLVHLVETSSPPSVRETDTLEGEMVDVGELVAHARAEPGNYETWSSLVIDRLVASRRGVRFLSDAERSAAIPAEPVRAPVPSGTR